jgi:simple sugar transport system ATP-binding protein
MTMAEELVRMEKINKFFGRVQALEDVSLSIRKNEIVGLLGDNGAGKSTLIKILSGALTAERGDIYINGRKVDISVTRPTPSPTASRRSIRTRRW